MTSRQLQIITHWLAENIFKNTDIMYSPYVDEVACMSVKDDQSGEEYDLTDIIASLHNLLYEAIEGKRYNYMHHHCNKIGSDCIDNLFDDMTKGAEENEK